MFLVNGESTRNLDLSDRGLQYGDGLFETFEILEGQAVFFQRHLARLQEGCARLLIPAPETELLADEAQGLCQHSSRAVLKLIITRGVGGRGYQQPDSIQATRIFSLHPYPDYPEELKEEGITVRFCKQRLSHNPALAGIKHLNRLEQVLARAEWQNNTIHEGLMFDSNAHIVEGTMSNLFVVRNNELFTPELKYCGIDGIMRGVVIDAATAQGIKVNLSSITQNDILIADELFVTNSVIGIWPVKKLGQQQFTVGPLTREVISWVNDAKRLDLQAC